MHLLWVVLSYFYREPLLLCPDLHSLMGYSISCFSYSLFMLGFVNLVYFEVVIWDPTELPVVCVVPTDGTSIWRGPYVIMAGRSSNGASTNNNVDLRQRLTKEKPSNSTNGSVQHLASTSTSASEVSFLLCNVNCTWYLLTTSWGLRPVS